MNQQVYDLMDWTAIEEITYSECSNPHAILGPHMTPAGMLVQVYIPNARDVTVKITATGKKYPMELADESGFFAALIPRKSITDYTLLVFYDSGELTEIRDPYAYGPQITAAELARFAAGTNLAIADRLGAHPTEVRGTAGVLFAVWAPGALRVSVVGDFNLWDGRRHQMRRLSDSGVFELFIPGLKPGAIYKYELKNKGGAPFLKADPFASAGELRPSNASIVWDTEHFTWTDDAWMEKRAAAKPGDGPLLIYEVHLGSWKRKELTDREKERGDAPGFLNYREIAPELAAWVREMGYTHVELMPVMEHPLDASWGYQTTGYFAPTRRFGTPDDFAWFMNYMHEQGIGVILDIAMSHFPKDAWALARFDGTPLFEAVEDTGSEAGTLPFRFGRPEVNCFLTASALCWAKKYHADGLRLDSVASMLYLDYHKNPGEWTANIYGGSENLEAVAFLQNLTATLRKKAPGILLIAQEDAAWAGVTRPASQDGLGFDYKWNPAWKNALISVMGKPAESRGEAYNDLTFGMLYHYSENFLLAVSHEDAAAGRCSMAVKMAGTTQEEKYAGLRAAYGYMAVHPGAKLLFMGQDFGQMDEWQEDRELEWDLLQYPIHEEMRRYAAALLRLVRNNPALWRMDYEPEGFEWINCMDAEKGVISFLRKTGRPEETLLVILNIGGQTFDKYTVGVPFAGKYKQIFGSEQEEFGGPGIANPRAKAAKEDKACGRDWSVTFRVPASGMQVFLCTPDNAGKPAEVPGDGGKKTGAAAGGKKRRSPGKAAADLVDTVKNAAGSAAAGITDTARKAAKKVNEVGGSAKEAILRGTGH